MPILFNEYPDAIDFMFGKISFCWGLPLWRLATESTTNGVLIHDLSANMAKLGCQGHKGSKRATLRSSNEHYYQVKRN